MAFCIHCGNELEEGTRFCTQCGAPIEGDGPSGGSSSSHPSASQNGSLPVVPSSGASSKGANRTLVVAIVLLAVAAVVLAAAVFIYLGSQSSNSIADSAPATSEQAESELASNLPSNADSPSGSSTGSESASSSGSGLQRSSSSSAVALSVTDDYKFINTFLSNFTEYPYWDYDTFTASNLDDTDLALFAAYHTGINSPSLVEEPGGSSNDFGVGNGGAAGGGCNQRITEARVQEVSQRYFGRTCNLSNVSASGYHYSGGYLYWGITAPYTPAGVACVSSVSDLGSNRYDVRFHLLGTDNGYESTSSSLYGLPEQKMAGTIGATRMVPCKAVVVASVGSDGKKTLKLESYGLDY